MIFGQEAKKNFWGNKQGFTVIYYKYHSPH